MTGQSATWSRIDNEISQINTTTNICENTDETDSQVIFTDSLFILILFYKTNYFINLFINKFFYKRVVHIAIDVEKLCKN